MNGDADLHVQMSRLNLHCWSCPTRWSSRAYWVISGYFSACIIMCFHMNEDFPFIQCRENSFQKIVSEGTETGCSSLEVRHLSFYGQRNNHPEQTPTVASLHQVVQILPKQWVWRKPSSVYLWVSNWWQIWYFPCSLHPNRSADILSI